MKNLEDPEKVAPLENSLNNTLNLLRKDDYMEDLSLPFDPYQNHQRHFDCICDPNDVAYKYIVCRRNFFSRPWPRVGKCVRGILWMQGYCI